MVVISHCPPSTINAYSTSPLTDLMTSTVQHGIYDGSRGRFGDSMLQVTFHDRPDFHGLSHYELRKLLDSEHSPNPFLIVDNQTPDTDAVWYVPDTAKCESNSDPLKFPPAFRPIKYPDEDFILWQAHMRVSDVPISSASWNVGWGDIIEVLLNNYPRYDPHDPQNTIIRMEDIDWNDREEQVKMWGFVNLRANWSEVEWSRDPDDRRSIAPRPPVVTRLTSEAAEEAGLLPVWTPKQQIATVGEEVPLIAYYDWNSPIWPTGYPDDPSNDGAVSHLQLPQTLHSLNGSRTFPLPTICPTMNWLKQNVCTRSQIARVRQNIRLSSTRNISEYK